MCIDKDTIIKALEQIVHPVLGKNIIDLNLVQRLQITDNSISFSLVFSNNDPLKASIKKACLKTLKENIKNNRKIEIAIEEPNQKIHSSKSGILPKVKNIIAIASGKGGVGKSTVTVNLAIAFARTGAKVGLIDADIFGPSVPKMLKAEHERPFAHNVDGKDLILPVERYGIKVLSIGFFIDPSDATIWRGPMASNALRQLMTDADWGEIDYMFVDLPPGTSDIHLTLVQTVPVTGVVIISTPQDVALADAIKGVSMFRNQNINVPVLGLVENMSWFTPEELPGNKYYIFGKDGGKKLASKLSIPFLGQIPIVQSIRESCDTGEPSILRNSQVSDAFRKIAENLDSQIKELSSETNPSKKEKIKP